MPTVEASYLLILYSGMILLNVLISFWFWLTNRNSLYSSLVRMWVGVFIALWVGGLAQGNPILFVLAGMIPGPYIAAVAATEILLRFINKKPNRIFIYAVGILSFAASVISYFAGLPFVIFAMPSAAVVVLPFAYGLVRLVREKKEKLTPAKMGFVFTYAVMALHSLDFPFLGNRPDTIIIGFSVGIVIAFGFAIFGPMVIVEMTSAEAAQLKLERGVIEKELQEAEGMLELIADTASLLPLSLDYNRIVEKTAELAVKHFGGFCVIHARSDGSDALQLVALAHGHEGNANSVREYHERYLITANSPDGPGRVMRNGESEVAPVVTDQPTGYLKAITDVGLKSYTSVPLFDRGRVCGVLTLLSNVRSFAERDTRLLAELANRASSAIQSAKLFEEAQRAVRLRDDFLLIASHELKTPLTSLNIQIETLRRLAERERLEAIAPGQLKRMLQTSAEQLKNLAKLIDGLLDVSLVATSGVVLGVREDVNLAQLVREVVDRSLAQSQLSTDAVEIKAEPTVIGRWDKLRIEQVVTNLITNAVKYGAGQPIKIDVRSNDGKAQLMVQDFGIGIDPENHERIFGRFERAVPIRRFGGLGLGLYITREIVRAHGGTIRFESEPGSGTAFIVELPLRFAETAKQSA